MLLLLLIVGHVVADSCLTLSDLFERQTVIKSIESNCIEIYQSVFFNCVSEQDGGAISVVKSNIKAFLWKCTFQNCGVTGVNCWGGAVRLHCPYVDLLSCCYQYCYNLYFGQCVRTDSTETSMNYTFAIHSMSTGRESSSIFSLYSNVTIRYLNSSWNSVTLHGAFCAISPKVESTFMYGTSLSNSGTSCLGLHARENPCAIVRCVNFINNTVHEDRDWGEWPVGIIGCMKYESSLRDCYFNQNTGFTVGFWSRTSNAGVVQFIDCVFNDATGFRANGTVTTSSCVENKYDRTEFNIEPYVSELCYLVNRTENIYAYGKPYRVGKVLAEIEFPLWVSCIFTYVLI